MTSPETVLTAGAMLLLVSVLASKMFGRLGIPALLVFLCVGMLAGSDGPGGIHFDNPGIAQTLGNIALVLILFSGGLDTVWNSVKSVFWAGFALSTLGVLITAGLVAWFAVTLLGFPLLEGLLLGATVSSTDAAAVFNVLRSKNVSLKGRIKPLLELESGSNDPMAIFLTIGLVFLLKQPGTSPFQLAPIFFKQMLIGACAGVVFGKTAAWLVNRVRLEFEGLYPVLTLSLVGMAFGLTQIVGGNGFLAVYLFGVILGNSNFIHKRSLLLFHDGMAWLMQIAMFLTLGLLVFPTKLVPVASAGILLSIFLIVVARPLSVFISLAKSGFNVREKLMVSWVGLRGAVPIVLATYPLVAGVPRADSIFNLVFFIVLVSVLLQGTTIPWVARKLSVDDPLKGKFRFPIEFVGSGSFENDLIELDVPPDSEVAGKSIVELDFPPDALIVLLQRGGDVIVPRGSTHLEANDSLLVLAKKETLAKVRSMVRSKHG